MKSAGYATNGHLFFLNVGLKRAVGARRFTLPATSVLVADIAAKRRALTADFTSCCHSPRRLADSGPVKQFSRTTWVLDAPKRYATNARSD